MRISRLCIRLLLTRGTGSALRRVRRRTAGPGIGPRLSPRDLDFSCCSTDGFYAELKTVANATRMGRSDARAAAAAARREGFPQATIIFLDQEQGGRMLPEQKAYIYAWVDGVIAAGFRAGIYCSGIVATDDGNAVTAEDIREHAGGREIVYWAINDACPPAPGCAFPQHPSGPAESGVKFAEVWQFAQSPQRKDVAARCTNYNRDGNCDAPGVKELTVDLNSATSADPSHGRAH